MPFFASVFFVFATAGCQNREYKSIFFSSHSVEIYEISRTSQIWQTFFLHSRQSIGGFHAISGYTNNNGEMNKCWWTNKAS